MSLRSILCLLIIMFASAGYCLNQSVSAQDRTVADIGFVGLHGGIYGQLEKFASELDLKLRYFEDSEIESGVADFACVGVLYVQHTRAEDREKYQRIFRAAKTKNPNLTVIAFQSSTQELFRSLGLADVLVDDEQAGKYYGIPGKICGDY